MIEQKIQEHRDTLDQNTEPRDLIDTALLEIQAGVRSRGIWLESVPSLWPGSGSSINFSLITYANCMVHNLFLYIF